MKTYIDTTIKNPRIYYEGQLKIGMVICINNENYHYLINVLRIKQNQTIIEIFNNSSNTFYSEIIHTFKKKFY
ncbi:hypothetical protein HIC20_01205 [Buchnera aphidicola (Hormaphis cornu)]|nr:hypothetical protein HIC20_01205 [Buchnera aphidicola (Hormaphis cornu)]